MSVVAFDHPYTPPLHYRKKLYCTSLPQVLQSIILTPVLLCQTRCKSCLRHRPPTCAEVDPFPSVTAGQHSDISLNKYRVKGGRLFYVYLSVGLQLVLLSRVETFRKFLD